MRIQDGMGKIGQALPPCMVIENGSVTMLIGTASLVRVDPCKRLLRPSVLPSIITRPHAKEDGLSQGLVLS